MEVKSKDGDEIEISILKYIYFFVKYGGGFAYLNVYFILKVKNVLH